MDKFYMNMALELAALGEGFVNPNPLVGAVVVRDEKVIGRGFHKRFGGDHAEVEAIRDVLKNKESLEDACMYVTLEPCSHFGKTPPCVEAVIKSGIKRVVVGIKDPNPSVAGKGILALREANIEVVEGVLDKECRKINEVFFKFITSNRPFVTLKYAMTLDGKIATHNGDSKWISNEESRHFVHKLRHKNTAIMVGVGTVIKDNPSLNTRLKREDSRDPVRIIVDTTGKTPLDSSVLNIDSLSETIIATTDSINNLSLKALKDKRAVIISCPRKDNHVDLKFLLDSIHKRGIDSVLLEGGSELSFSMLKEGLIDKVITFIAPKLIGGRDSKTPIGGVGIDLMSHAVETTDVTYKAFKEDLCIESYIKGE